jgi:hypothetical protein
MKLSKFYSLKKSKSHEVISFTLLMPTLKFEEKKDSFEIVLSHTKVVFNSPKSAKKDQNMTILGHKKSLLYFKSVDFLPKNDRYVCF